MSASRLSLGVVGVNVEMPANGEDRLVTFTWTDPAAEDWQVVVAGEVVASLSSGGDELAVTFAAASLGAEWHVGPVDAPEVARGRLVAAGTASAELALDVGGLAITVGSAGLTIDVVARGEQGVQGEQGDPGVATVAGTAATAGLVSLDGDELTVDLPDASQVAIDVSSLGLSATDTEAAVIELATGVGESIVASTLVSTNAAHLAAEQATASRPRLTRWSVSDATEAVSFAERDAANLDMWPDGSIGFASISGTTYGFAANGTASARWTATAGDLLGTVQATASTITTTIPSDYAAGGPIVARGSGKLVKLYHAEKHDTVPGQTGSFLSWLGLAVADEADPDDWTDLGAVITPAVGVDAAMWCDVGGGAACVVDGYLYVYFTDTLTAQYDRVPFAVARCLVADILTWANGGAPATFAKWHLGAWDEPGIDGDSSPVLVGGPTPNWCDAITLTSHDDRVLLVWSGKLSPAATDTHWGVWCAVSAPGDPLSFGRVETIVEPHRRFYAYPTLVAPDLSGLGNTVTGDSVRLYLTESDVGAFENGGSRWEDAWVSLRTLTWNTGRMTLLGGSAQFFADDEDEPRLFAGYYPGIGGFIGFGNGTDPIDQGVALSGDTLVLSGADFTVQDVGGVGGTVQGVAFYPVGSGLDTVEGSGAITGTIASDDGGVPHILYFPDPEVWVPVEIAYVSAWADLSLVNSWVVVPSLGMARYRLLGRHMVELELFVRSGTSGTVCATLPEGYRPDAAESWFTFRTNGMAGGVNAAAVAVATNGEITPYINGTLGTNTDVYLRRTFIRAT